MKRYPLLLIALGALITATAFHYFKNTSNKIKTVEELKKKWTLVLRCSPTFIPGAGDSIHVLPGWGNYSWKITTASDSAQFYFNQGINMYYAFHIIEARASFDRSVYFDSSCAMAWWGKALAFGPNINDFGYQRPSEAFSSATRAMQLKNNTTETEKALINAISVRYLPDSSVDQSKLNELYRDAMKKVYQQYAANADVVTLYADALMLLHPWDLYDHNYLPKKWTTEIVQVIKNALKISPRHPGANHYYIHAVEASANPGLALSSADLLSTMMPDVAHVTHMPSHIYIRTGNYQKGIEVNNNALFGFEKYVQLYKPARENVALYSLHNLHMKVSCAQMAGNSKAAFQGSEELKAAIPGEYMLIPGALGNFIQYVHGSDLLSFVRFGKWEMILKLPVNDSLSFHAVMQRFARGMAFSRTGNTDKAIVELNELKRFMLDTLLKEPFTPFNSVYDAGLIAQHILEGCIKEQQGSYTDAIDFYKKAITAEDKLIYNEPRDWLLPARHYLGNVLLKAKRFDEAEKVFQQDLKINPRNGWSLTGLWKIYEAKKNKLQLTETATRINEALTAADIKIDAPVF